MQVQKKSPGRPVSDNPQDHRINMSFDDQTFNLIAKVSKSNGWSLAKTVRQMISTSELLQKPIKVIIAGKEVFLSQQEADALLHKYN